MLPEALHQTGPPHHVDYQITNYKLPALFPDYLSVGLLMYRYVPLQLFTANPI
jgi:hypothetical protein